MPHQDGYGRWISDDGRAYWDGTAWQAIPTAVPYVPSSQMRQGSGARPWLIGCGIALLLGILLSVGCGAWLVNDPSFQRGYCDGYTNHGQNSNVCPFNPPATP